MKRHPFQNRCTRARLTLLVVLSLLFRQVALAAYACPKLGAPAVNAAVSMHCGDMAMTLPGQGATLCARQPLTGQHAQLPPHCSIVDTGLVAFTGGGSDRADVRFMQQARQLLTLFFR